MSQDRTLEVSEAEIAVHWQEEAYVHPPEKFIAQANLTDKTVFERFSLDNFPDCFKEYADLLDWYKTWDVTLDTSNPPFWRWFVGGRINASYNCVDRHLAKYKNKTAIHFVPEPEHEIIQHVTFQELYVRVNEVAALLQDFCGLKKGDRVTLHLPMVAELPITMLACARLGVIHSQVLAHFIRPKARLCKGSYWTTPVGSSEGHTLRADVSRDVVNALRVAIRAPRASRPAVHGPDFCNSNATRLNSSASGQHEARKTRMRLAVSVMRPAIFRSCRRRLANSLCRSGVQDGAQSRRSSSSQ